MDSDRFNDQNKTLEDFNKEVLVSCPNCTKKAFSKVNHDKKEARLICSHCSFSKTSSTIILINGKKAEIILAAHLYFEADLWLKWPFKGDEFWAYNLEHLNYLESYIAAKVREHKERTGFTLIEKLPRFYHESKNRKELLKMIEKLKLK
jgi:hypothetical protein